MRKFEHVFTFYSKVKRILKKMHIIRPLTKLMITIEIYLHTDIAGKILTTANENVTASTSIRNYSGMQLDTVFRYDE